MDDDDDDHRWEEHLDETPPGWDEEEGEMMEMEEESRNYIATPGRLWPGGIVPYRIDSSLDSCRQRIETAIAQVIPGTSNLLHTPSIPANALGGGGLLHQVQRGKRRIRVRKVF